MMQSIVPLTLRALHPLARIYWRWDVLLAVVALLYGFGYTSLYADDYLLGICLCQAGMIALVTRLAFAEEVTSENTKNLTRFFLLLLAAVLIYAPLGLTNHRKKLSASTRKENELDIRRVTQRMVPSPPPGWDIKSSKPNSTNIENHGTTDIATGVVHHRTRNEILRGDIGDLIDEGTKVRDRAPIYVGPPIREPGGPDIVAEWTAWNSKVEQFLQQNFDSAEAEKFRALNNPMTSLNSVVDYEIAYLSDLLNRIEPRTSGTSIGAVTQGPGSALSINQQGGITAGTVNLGPQLRFPEKRIDELAGLLAAHRGRVNVSTDNADSITLRDATNLVTAFAKAKWSTAGPNVSIHGTDIGADGLPVPVRTGIHISTRTNNSALAEFIKQAIKQATGVDAYEETSAKIANDDVEIFVGPSE
jgi:hypothetical protein